MSDWQVGDLAVCVDARPNPRCGHRPSPLVEGKVYRVAGIDPYPERHALYGMDTGLFLRGMRSAANSGGFAASRFRKIRPDEHEACEPEFVQLLKRSKRKVNADA